LILRKIGPAGYRAQWRLFIALNDSDLAYGETFIEGCRPAHPSRADHKADPGYGANVNPKVLMVFLIPDGTLTRCAWPGVLPHGK